MTILYDFIETAGGAEKVSIDLANYLGNSLIVSGVNPKSLEILPKLHSELICLGKNSSIPLWKSIKSIRYFENIDKKLLSSEKILFSGSNAPLAVASSEARQNIYYCHTPPRFIYDLYEHYQKTLPAWQASIVKQFANWIRKRYEPSIKSMDKVIANSKTVQARLKNYLDVESEVLYPPVDITNYYYRQANGYYLSTARLEEYKRVQLIVDAFKKMPDKSLVLVSGGSLLKTLQQQTQHHHNIKVVGWVTKEELHKYIAECIATIYLPIDEDFGMSPVESMAAGKPVIGVAEGGVQETVVHHETGFLCNANPTIEDIADAVNWLTPNIASQLRTNCQHRALQFEPEVFFRTMKEVMS